MKAIELEVARKVKAMTRLEVMLKAPDPLRHDGYDGEGERTSLTANDADMTKCH